MRSPIIAVLCKATLLLTIIMLPALKLFAQTDITIGTGTTGNGTSGYPCPIQDYFEGSRAQYLYKASELVAAGMGPGMISAIKFNVTALNDAEIVEQYAIKIAATTSASLSATTWENAGNNVYGPVNYQPVTGVNSFAIAPSFFWNGTDNLIVEVCSGDPGNGTGTWWSNNPTVPWTTGLTFNGSHTNRVDNGGNLCNTTSTTNSGTMTTRPNIILNWTPAAACTGTPNAGTAVASATSVCLNGSVTLLLNGVTVASGLTYQWQSSPDNAAWSNIAGATSSAYTGTQAQSTYYRCVVTCSSTGGGSANSTAVQVTTPAQVQGTFTINKGAPAGGGNFQSFNAAYDYIKCGISGAVVFNVVSGSGPYNEQLNITPVPGASAANTITFNGNGNTISYLSSNTNERAVIKLDDANFFTFDSLTIVAEGQTASEYGFGVQLLNNADSNVVNSCTIIIDSTSNANRFAGISVSNSASNAIGTGDANCDHNTFSNNTIRGGYYGITLVGSSTVANGNNKIINNKVTEFYNYGIYVYGSFNTLIEGNIINRPTRATVTTFYGLYVTNLNTRLNINANRIYDPFGGAPSSTSAFYGIYFTNVDALSTLENIVSNNLIYKLTGNGDAYGIYNSGSDNVWYYHNTFSMDGETTGSSNITRGFYQTTLGSGIVFSNNIITITRESPGQKHSLYFNTAGSDIISNYNNLYIAPTVTNAFTGYKGNNMATLADWQTGAVQDTNSITVNPIYKDINAGDYTPANAAANDRGTNVGITADINWAARSTTTPDMGAYEFTPAPCTVPPTAGTATVSADPVCVNTAVTLNLTGNSMGLTQTYQWQVADNAAGPFTNLGNVLPNPDTIIIATVTQYYRAAITCSGNTAYSSPVLLTVNPALAPNTYTIDKTIPASATNFVSFAAAKAALECGISGPVIFDVVAGRTPYEEQLVLDTIAGVSAVNTITFMGNGNTIRFSSDNTDDRAVIKLKRADYITFDSLTIDATGSGTYGFGVQLIDHADSNTIRNCNIIIPQTSTSTNYAGIVISASHTSATSTGAIWCNGNTIDNNTVTGGYYGITIAGGNTNGNPATGNTITNNTVQEFYYYGIYLNSTIGTLVEGNLVTRPTRTNVTSCYAIYATGGNSALTISKNTVTSPFGGNTSSTSTFYGIYIASSSGATGTENKVINNQLYNLVSSGTQYAFYNSGSGSTHYYHNTISLDNTTTSSSITRGFYQTGTADDIRFINNIITITSQGTGAKYAVYFGTTANTIVADNNNYYLNAAGTQNFVGYFGSNQATLADWQAASSQDTNSLSIDPVYADLANGNLKPVISPMDNTGQPVGVTTDILNQTRSTTTPDIGAYEIEIPNCVKPPNAGAATANPSTGICMGTIITLDLSGNTSGGQQTYQWQIRYDDNSAWQDLGDVRYIPTFKTELGTNNYFRCVIVCGGTDTAYSTPVHVDMNPPLLKGVYTINPAGSGSRNYPSFSAVVAELDCGIAGEVIFEAVPGTYNEQIRMHEVPGASDTSRIIFRSQNGDPASVILTYEADNANNYVLKLDSANYVTYDGITIAATDDTYGRVVELAGTAAYDSLLNCNIKMPVTDNATTNMVGVFADDFKGNDIVISGNTITNGTSGIHISGTGTTTLAAPLVIDSNTVTGGYQHGIYTYYTSRIRVNKNKVTMSGELNSTAYGIYTGYGDTAYQVTRNFVNIRNTDNDVYGIYMYYCDGDMQFPGIVEGNRIVAITGNTGELYGLGYYYGGFNSSRNNVVSVKTTGDNSYALYSYNPRSINFDNNTFKNTSTSDDDNVAGYLYNSSASYGNLNLRNNIFSHGGGGLAMLATRPEFISTDYNNFYTSGTTLLQSTTPALEYTTLQAWRDTTDLDLSSIVYEPAFVNDSTLEPDVTNPDVWAIHGRGVQLPGNDSDINNQFRPTLLTEGVPDMGAFEFLPTVPPPVLPVTPAAPAAGATQTVMFGTDTVMKIKWAPNTTVPTSIKVQRYSGIIPPNLSAGMEYMYFYTDVNPEGTDNYKFDLQQFYVDSWRGFIELEEDIRLGRTDTSDTWLVNDSSTVNLVTNVIADTSLQYIDKFTGLKGEMPDIPDMPTPADSSNRGTRFWVGYGHHQFFGTNNTQEMVLYLSAEEEAHVTVRINGTSWIKSYTVPANTVITSDLIPKMGLSDARLMTEGLSEKGISIESDIPVVAYAHIYGSQSSGASMLLPVGTYGYEYYALMSRQYYASNTYSWFYIIADRNNTVVEITPSVPTLGGRQPDVPFTVTLNKGEVYQVMGAIQSGSEGYDLSGSRVRSIENSEGKCYPVAMFSGNSRTSTGCGGTTGSSGDNNIQQNFPSQAWGKRYLTAPTSSSTDATLLSTNIFRVMVRDTATAVMRNNVRLRGLINNRYYQYESNVADYITADQPIMVAQYLPSSGSCGIVGLGDPELFYISPLEQGIKKVGLYRNTEEGIVVNYLTLIIPTGGLSSLLIDNSNIFDYVYAHPALSGYSVVVKRWDAAQAQSTASSDSAFTAITYGQGSAESYGFNAGTLVRNLNMLPGITNTYDQEGGNADYTCAKTPFRFNMMLPTIPTSITWELSKVSNLSPAADILQTNPVPVDSMVANDRKYYKFTIPTDYVFSQPGTYYVPIKMSHPDIESCGNTTEALLEVKVIGAPVVDFSVAFSGCLSDEAVFNGTVTTENGIGADSWKWHFGDGDSATVQQVTRQYAAAGTYDVQLNVITTDGCIGDTVKTVTVNEPAAAVLVEDSLNVCAGTDVTFSIQNPETGVTYNWYNAATGGTLAGTGTSFTIPAASGPAAYYVETVKDGCTGVTRVKATLMVLPQLIAPVAIVDSTGVNVLRFRWDAVPNASGYEVSTDAGVNWSAPSSGAMGLVHTISGLQPGQTVTLIVKVKGCEDKISDPVSGITLPDGVYIPNAFSPNGDGLNDMLMVYGAIIKEMHIMIFNQWGEKVFESNSQARGWDGRYKGKELPSGVYIYVCKLKLIDGAAIEKKGSINLLH